MKKQYFCGVVTEMPLPNAIVKEFVFVISSLYPCEMRAEVAFRHESDARAELAKQKSDLFKCMQDNKCMFTISVNDEDNLVLTSDDGLEYAVYLNKVELKHIERTTAEDIADAAVEIADALIAKLRLRLD